MIENFGRIAVVDFEYEVADGELPNALCMVAHVLDEHLEHVRTIKLWRGEFGATPPFDIGPDTLFVAYSAWAEMTVLQGIGLAIPSSHLRPAHHLSRRQQRPAALRTRHSEDVSRQRAWRPPAALTVSRVGLASTKTPCAQAIGDGSWRGKYSPEQILALLRRRRAHVRAAAARAAPRPPWTSAGRHRASAALVELQREIDRADPGARHADRRAAVEPGAGEQGRSHRRAAAPARSEPR